MGMQSKPVQGKIATEDVLVIPESPLPRARAKILKETATGMINSIEEQVECLGQISNHEAFALMEFSRTSWSII